MMVVRAVKCPAAPFQLPQFPEELAAQARRWTRHDDGWRRDDNNYNKIFALFVLLRPARYTTRLDRDTPPAECFSFLVAIPRNALR